MHNPNDFLIFWLPPGYTFDNSGIDPSASAPSDATYERLLNRYFADVCKPNALYPVIHQYSDSLGGVGSCSFGGYWTDNVTYPGGRGAQNNPLTDADIQSEVLRAMTSNGWVSNNGSNLFLVYTGYSVYSCMTGTSCSFSTFCAYHSYLWNGVPVIYADMPDAGTSNACQGVTSPNGDVFADSEISISSHEQFEAFTDPTFGGWIYPPTGSEIGDECAWVFGSNGATLLVGSNSYVVQDEWSNDLNTCTLFECGSTGLPILAADVLGCNGIGPTSIGLKWGVSGYGVFFNRYEIQEKTFAPSNSWVTIFTITDSSATTYYVNNLLPNTTYTWRVVDFSCCVASATSNAIQVQQPSTAMLFSNRLSSSAYQFSWNNNANYTGPVAFNSYMLMELANHGTYTMVANLTSASATSVIINGLAPSANYSFYLATTNTCNGCSGSSMSSSYSNAVGVNGPPIFIGGLFGEYWNASFFGAALMGCTTYNSPTTPSSPPGYTSTDLQVNFGTAAGWNWHPVGSGNEFSAKWIGGIMIPANGTYSFQLASDDGSWLYIDSVLILNHGGQHAITDSPGTTSLFLTRGLHQIEVDYYETCGSPSGITLSWSPPRTTGFVLVPPSVLVSPPRLDGQGVYTGSCIVQGSCQLLSTNNGGDVIVVVADCEIQSQTSTCTSTTPSVSDSIGLGFSLRGSYCFGGTSFGSCIWEYYAVANSPLNKDNITSLSNPPPGGIRWGIMTLAISGANTNAIFDSSLPAGQNCSALNGASADCGIGIATSTASAPAPYELLLAMTAQNDAGPCNPPTTQGWYTTTFTGGNQELQYQIVPVGTNNHSFTCSGSADPLITFADGIQAPAPDFTIAGNPSVVTVDAGIVGNTTFSLASLDGFAGTIRVGVSSAPAGLSCSLSTSSIVLSSVSSSTLSCLGIAGFYNVTLTGTGGGKSHSARIAFNVVDFTLNGSPKSLNISVGSNATSTITLASLGGFSDTVNVTAVLLDYHAFGGGGAAGHTFAMAAITCNLNMTLSAASIFVPQNATGQTVITVSALSCTAPGIYDVAISASRNELVRTFALTVTVPVPGSNGPTGSASVVQTTFLGQDPALSSLGMILIGGLALFCCVLASPGESTNARYQSRRRAVQPPVSSIEFGTTPSVILQSRRLG